MNALVHIVAKPSTDVNENDCLKFPHVFFSLTIEARSEMEARLSHFSVF